MERAKLPIDALPSWCKRHGVQVNGVSAAHIEGRGNGLIANKVLSGRSHTPLLVIPKNVIISEWLVDLETHKNEHFRQLVQTLNFKSERQLVLLYMLMRLVLSSNHRQNGTQDATEAWTAYIGLQPSDVPVPTTWSNAELSLLRATSLESAVAAKTAMLNREFATMQAKTSAIPFWKQIFSDTITLRDWIWLDALFRSRSFELPMLGECMLPCVDLANHSTSNTAYCHQDPETGNVTLALHDGCSLSPGEEVTISYGKDKPAAEMLFNYGFIDSSSTIQSMVLALDDMLEPQAGVDPLLEAKLQVYNSAPTLELKVDEKGRCRWSAPFLYLLCVNEQDGLSFREEKHEEESSLKMLWRGRDITRRAGMFSIFINSQDIRQVVQFRTVSMVLGMVEKQLGRIRVEQSRPEGEVRGEVLQAALQLRSIETAILESSFRALTDERDQLLNDESVARDMESIRSAKP